MMLCYILYCCQESELERLTRAREAETKFIREQNDLEITKAKEMAGIETEKFKNMVDSIGSDTIASIANAGPEMQVGMVVYNIIKGQMLDKINSYYNVIIVLCIISSVILISLSCCRSRCYRLLD